MFNNIPGNRINQTMSQDTGHAKLSENHKIPQ